MNTIRFPDPEIVALQASNWIAKIDRSLTPAENKQFNDWLDESPVHGEALIKYATMWDMLDVLRPMAKILPIELFVEKSTVGLETSDQEPLANQEPLTDKEVSQDRSTRKFVYAIAASITLAIGLFSLLPSTQPSSPATTTLTQTENIVESEPIKYLTEVGESKNLTLSDGSELKLNTNTEILVEYSSGFRKVEIVRGEVYFDIAKNIDRPFIAVTADGNITAVGTAFNIQLSQFGGTEVSVTEGKVKVDNFSGLNSISSQSAEVFLSKGQKAQIREKTAEVSSPVDLNSELAWHKGMVLFNGETLEQVVNEIGRYTPLNFKILDPEIASVQVGGYFKTGDMEQLLVILEQNFGVQSQRRGNQIELSRKQ